MGEGLLRCGPPHWEGREQRQEKVQEQLVALVLRCTATVEEEAAAGAPHQTVAIAGVTERTMSRRKPR